VSQQFAKPLCRTANCKLLGLHFDDCNTFLLSFQFDDCLLNYSSFYQLKLKNTRFRNCVLHEVDFVEADLSGAVFQNCDLNLAVFENTILEGADFVAAHNFTIDPTKNRIKKAKFSFQNLVGLLTEFGIEIIN
jgi:fluoroquinolone resistance protein